MSSQYQNKSNLDIAAQAERDLNSYQSKTGNRGASDSTAESGIDESATNKFPGSDVIYGSAASGAGNNREIPLSEGGSLDPRTGKPYKAGAFEGEGGPEDKARIYAAQQGGNDDVRGNVRQGGDTSRPPGQIGNQSGEPARNVQ